MGNEAMVLPVQALRLTGALSADASEVPVGLLTGAITVEDAANVKVPRFGTLKALLEQQDSPVQPDTQVGGKDAWTLEACFAATTVTLPDQANATRPFARPSPTTVHAQGNADSLLQWLTNAAFQSICTNRTSSGPKWLLNGHPPQVATSGSPEHVQSVRPDRPTNSVTVTVENLASSRQAGNASA